MTRRAADRDRLLCTESDFTAPASGCLAKTATVARFVARVNTLGPHDDASPERRSRILAAVKSVAARIDVDRCAGEPTGYARCLLYEDSAGWSLAAITLRPDQSTPIHDHGGWGGAVTVKGVERDRRFVEDRRGDLTLIDERDYPAGTGYVFDPVDVHQPVGVDPSGVTVSLHFLVHPSQGRSQRRHEHVAHRSEMPRAERRAAPATA